MSKRLLFLAPDGWIHDSFAAQYVDCKSGKAWPESWVRTIVCFISERGYGRPTAEGLRVGLDLMSQGLDMTALEAVIKYGCFTHKHDKRGLVRFGLACKAFIVGAYDVFWHDNHRATVDYDGYEACRFLGKWHSLGRLCFQSLALSRSIHKV